MANCNGINCVVLCRVIGKHAISSDIANKLHTYHLLLLSGLFSRLSGLGLCCLPKGFMGCLHCEHQFAAFSRAKILVYGFIKGDSDLFKEKFLPTFRGGFGNHLFSKLAVSSKKEELGLRGSAAVWHLIFRAYYY